MIRRFLSLIGPTLLCVGTLALTGCPGPAKTPLPSGLPPEYEAPRRYTPVTDIDNPEKPTDDFDDESGFEEEDGPPAPLPAPAEPTSPEPAPAEPAPTERAPTEPATP